MLKAKPVKIITFTGLVAAVLLVAAGIFMTSDFVARHFSSAGILPESTIHAIQVLRVSAVCFGIVAAVLAANLLFPLRMNRCFDFASRSFFSLLGNKLQLRRYYLPFCFACFGIALILGLLMTQSGSGLSPDSVNYMVAGENLYHGHGFGTAPYGVFIHHPGYPLLIAGFMVLGFDAEQAARIIPILSVALLVFPLFFLGKRIGGVLTGYVACLMCLALTPLLWLATWAWTDMPYIFFSVLAILFLVEFAQSSESSNKTLFLGAFFISAATLTRSIGLTIFVVGLLIILVKQLELGKVWNRKYSIGVAVREKSKLTTMVYQILVFSLICLAPILLYIARNCMLTGHWYAGYSGPAESGISEMVPDLLHWIVVSIPQNLATLWFFSGLQEVWSLSGMDNGLWLVLAVILVCLLLLAVCIKTGLLSGKSLLRCLGKSYVPISYIFVYLSAIVATGVTWYMTKQQNYLVPVYPLIILVVVSVAIWAWKETKRTWLRPTFFSLIVILVTLFVALQVGSSLSYYSDFDRSEFGRGYNSPACSNEEGMAWMASNVSDDATIYTDNRVVVWFVLRRPVPDLPYSANNLEGLHRFFEKLEHEENLYIICFKGKLHWQNRPSNSEIAELNQEYDVLEIVADFPTSTIWRVRSTWVSPTGFNDPEGDWDRETYAYDGHLDTNARNIGCVKDQWAISWSLRTQ